MFDGWRDDVLTGPPPVLFPIGAGDLARIEIGPGLVTLFGGVPGAGKSAFVMQPVTDALRLTPTLRALVCSIEMPPRVLLDRQLARLSGIDLTSIRYRRIRDEALRADGFEPLPPRQTPSQVADRAAIAAMSLKSCISIRPPIGWLASVPPKGRKSVNERR